MRVTLEKPEQAALTIEQSAAALGLDEFSLLSRIQTGQINAVRARSGEMMIPQNELERAVGGRVSVERSKNSSILPDESLGIERRLTGLRRNGELSSPYAVGHHRLSGEEINSYRTAASAIAGQLNHTKELHSQLNSARQPFPDSRNLEVETSDGERWKIHSTLLNLDHGQILLCQRSNDFAIVERFNEDSRYAQANGNAQILLQGNDSHELTRQFKENAGLTLEFMASNLSAKAQKIAWEQFPNQRPGQVVAAITERCHQAIRNQESLSQSHRMNRGYGMSI